MGNESPGLWTEHGADGDRVKHVLEQWKVLVTSADAVSSRRSTLNALFVSVNTGILAVFAVMWRYKPEASVSTFALVPFLLAALAVCWLWVASVRSLRDLNEAKFQIIHDLESALPAAVFTEEQNLLIAMKRRPYRRMTTLEPVLPWLYGTAYGLAVIVAVATDLRG